MDCRKPERYNSEDDSSCRTALKKGDTLPDALTATECKEVLTAVSVRDVHQHRPVGTFNENTSLEDFFLLRYNAM